MICLCPSALHKMRFFWVTVFLWNLPLSSVLSLDCDMNKQYKWPYPDTPQWCCSKCKAGQYMISRCEDSTKDTVCGQCSEGMYTEVPNVSSRCKACILCGHNERRISLCTSEQNTVCECKPGYKRTDKSECEEERREVTTTATTTTTKPQQPTTTKQLPKPTPSNKSYESVLLPVVLTVCMCILLLIIATKLKKLELFGCCLIDDSTSSKDTQSTEEEPLPIQEVCSHLQEEWRKDGLESIVSMNE